MSLSSWKVIILVSAFVALGNIWLVHVGTFCPNDHEWELERSHWQMRVQGKDEEIRHLRDELRTLRERYEVEVHNKQSKDKEVRDLRNELRTSRERYGVEMRNIQSQVEEERKQNEAQLRLIRELELIIQDQNKTIHDLTADKGQN